MFLEALIIAYGDGRNGKSTFWNTLSRVLGSYSGNISADTLTVGCRRNVKPELAEAKGKRMLKASELEEGTCLNTANVKQFSSTDEIFAEKKYKEPFSYIPSHTLVLYTNHLPKVGTNDPGTWRRLIVIPFNAKIEGSSDIKNYADYLFENAGEAALAWMIEGAKKVIEKDFRIEAPECLKNAISAYREDNDWLLRSGVKQALITAKSQAISTRLIAVTALVRATTRAVGQTSMPRLRAPGSSGAGVKRGVLLMVYALKSQQFRRRQMTFQISSVNEKPLFHGLYDSLVTVDDGRLAKLSYRGMYFQ